MDVAGQAPVKGQFLDGRVEDVPDLRVGRCEVATVDLGHSHAWLHSAAPPARVLPLPKPATKPRNL